jgi:hypothetical protein
MMQHSSVAIAITAAAGLRSAAETIICYQKQRFRGSWVTGPGLSRYELGLQTKEAAVHSLVEICAAGEALAAMAFETTRMLDQLQEAGRQPEPTPLVPDLASKTDDAIAGGTAKLNNLATVFGMACELFRTRTGSRQMREAVNLLGGSGVLEDGPGLIGYKWAMSQLEGALGVSEPIQQFRLANAMTTEVFLVEFRRWKLDLQTIARSQTSAGAQWLATAMEMWLLTLYRLCPQVAAGDAGSNRRNIVHFGVEFELADILCSLLASRSQILDTVDLQRTRLWNRNVEAEQPEVVNLRSQLCYVQVGTATAEVVRVCAYLVHSYALSAARKQDWLDEFNVLQAQLSACHAESCLAKERAAELLTKIEIPGGLDCA